MLNPRLGGGFSLFDLAPRDSIFLAGYDAGGSALVMLGGDREFTRSRPFIKGIISVESPLWSAYTEETLEYEEPPAGAGWFARFRAGLGWKLSGLMPKKTAEPAPFPGLAYPLLFLVSDRVLGPGRRYDAVKRQLRASSSPVLLAAPEGAGPLDYSDFPLTYPLFSALFPGRHKEAWRAREATGYTASIMAAFAARVLETGISGAPGGSPGTALPQKAPLPADMHIESRSALNLLDHRLY
jgi:hypothetical protein